MKSVETSESRWQAVKKCLQSFGIDTERAMVRAFWCDPNGTTMQPLRVELEALTASSLRQKEPPTALQRAGEQQQTLAEIENLLGGRLKKYRALGKSFNSDDANEARAALTGLAARLRRQIAALKAQGSQSKYNARRSKELRNEFWIDSLELLQQVTPDRRLRRKEELNFLRACSPEQFKATDIAINTFLDRSKRAG